MKGCEGIFRPWEVSDIPAIAALEMECLSCPWNERMLIEEFENPLYRCMVFESKSDFLNMQRSSVPEQKSIIGYVGWWEVSDYAEIANVVVAPNLRRKGIARGLLQSLEDNAKEKKLTSITLEVGENNTPARTLYLTMGFCEKGRRPNYYGKESALILWKDINERSDH